MSFSSIQKREITDQPIKNACCRRALLSGVVASRGVFDGDDVTLSLDGERTVAFVCELIDEVFGVCADVSSAPNGGRRRIVSFSSPAARRYYNVFTEGGEYCRFKCVSCRAHFFKGLFLACGRLSDPEKKYALEFSLPEDRRNRFVELLTDCGLSPLIQDRRQERLIYFKNSSMIEDFCAISGMNNAAFFIMNAKINGQIRNEVKRVANCETNNIDKAVNASMKQIAAIKALDEAKLLSSLPEELENTARLRLKYSDLSLAQLAQTSVPPISKPGLSHRLKKLIQIAEQKLGKKFD